MQTNYRQITQLNITTRMFLGLLFLTTCSHILGTILSEIKTANRTMSTESFPANKYILKLVYGDQPLNIQNLYKAKLLLTRNHL